MILIDIKDDNYWINPAVIRMPANDATRHTWPTTKEIFNDEVKVTHFSLHIII